MEAKMDADNMNLTRQYTQENLVDSCLQRILSSSVISFVLLSALRLMEFHISSAFSLSFWIILGVEIYRIYNEMEM